MFRYQINLTGMVDFRKYFYVYQSGAQTRMFLKNQINIVIAGALASCVVQASAAWCILYRIKGVSIICSISWVDNGRKYNYIFVFSKLSFVWHGLTFSLRIAHYRLGLFHLCCVFCIFFVSLCSRLNSTDMALRIWHMIWQHNCRVIWEFCNEFYIQSKKCEWDRLVNARNT